MRLVVIILTLLTMIAYAAADERRSGVGSIRGTLAKRGILPSPHSNRKAENYNPDGVAPVGPTDSESNP